MSATSEKNTYLQETMLNHQDVSTIHLRITEQCEVISPKRIVEWYIINKSPLSESVYGFLENLNFAHMASAHGSSSLASELLIHIENVIKKIEITNTYSDFLYLGKDHSIELLDYVDSVTIPHFTKEELSCFGDIKITQDV